MNYFLILQGENLSIRIHRDITGEVWCGDALSITLKAVQITGVGQLSS